MRRLFIFLFCSVLCVASYAQQYEWKTVPMDGSRRAAVASGEITLKKNSSAAKVAEIIENAQPAMARVKEVLGTSVESLSVEYPESALSNWTIDTMMEEVSRMCGHKVDAGIVNFGGIRVDMPQGNIILDDILSMFPFKNNVIYLEHKGRTIRKIIEEMAATRFQVLGGLRVVAEGGKVVSLTIGNEPVDDEKVYSLVTNSFLLYGGDGLYLEKDAVNVVKYPVQVDELMINAIRKMTSEGKVLEYHKDGRVVIR